MTTEVRSHAAECLPAGALIGMIHVGSLPGTPNAVATVDELARVAAAEARVLSDAGFDAIIVENMHDTPYVHGRQGPEIVAAMTRVVLAVREVARVPLGVQVLSGGNKEALAVAQAAGGAFIRCENFVFSHVADEGLLAEAEAGPLLRYRRLIGADGGANGGTGRGDGSAEGRVAVYADLKKKHASHALTADISIDRAAEAAAYFGADGLIVTGGWTAEPADADEVKRVKRATGLPVLVGSGVTPTNAADLLEHADGLIVGSFIKAGGHWANGPDAERCRALVETVRAARR